MCLGFEAGLMLIQPAMHLVAMEADTCAAGDVASDTSPDAAQWKSAISEYSNVFKSPGMPAECDTVHRIKLEPGSVQPH